MNVLGLTAFSHESSACLLKDGKIVSFIEEERLNREKHTSKFPVLAIKQILKINKLKAKDIDQITFFWNPYKELTGNIFHILKAEITFFQCEFFGKLHKLSKPLRRIPRP